MAPPVDPGGKVLEYARAKLGERVGDGECAALVVAALGHAGLERPRGRGVWGEPLDSLAEVQPGDILQFEDATFRGRRLNPNGTLALWEFRFPEHTAIVSGVDRRGRGLRLRVIHQNARLRGRDESDVVKEWTLNLADLRGGSIRAYRPAPGSNR